MIVAATITRTELSQGDLDLNDKTAYILSENFEPGAVSWRREQVESPYVDSKFTTGRVRDVVEMRLGIQVLGANQPELATRVDALVKAFTQNEFIITVSLDGQVYSWKGEAADYTMEWSRERLHGRQVLMAFGFLRHPVPEAGPI